MIVENSLVEIRNKINILDEKLLILLSERRRLIIEIAKLKWFLNCSIRDIEREHNLLDRLIQLGKIYHLDDYYIRRLFYLIFRESISIQTDIITKLVK